jgi:putative membrane protein
MMFLWIIAILAVALWFSGAFGKRPGILSKPHTDALEILKQRYARGEIDKTEFEARKKDLTEG